MPRSVLLLAALFLVIPALATPINVIAPSTYTNVAGNAPDTLFINPTGSRSQEVIGSDQFSAFNGPVKITQLSFRAAPGTGPTNFPLSNLDLNLSTTPFFPNTSGGATLISSTFANNVGLDNTLVFSGPLALSSPGCAAGTAPCPFDMVITFTTPFLYNSANGSLLLDFRMNGLNGISGTLDGASFSSPGGPVASVGGLLNAASGDLVLQGDIVQLTLETPEPSSWALLLCGLGALAPLARRRNS